MGKSRRGRNEKAKWKNLRQKFWKCSKRSMHTGRRARQVGRNGWTVVRGQVPRNSTRRNAASNNKVEKSPLQNLQREIPKEKKKRNKNKNKKIRKSPKPEGTSHTKRTVVSETRKQRMEKRPRGLTKKESQGIGAAGGETQERELKILIREAGKGTEEYDKMNKKKDLEK